MFDREEPGRIMNFRPLLFTAVGFVAGLIAYRLYRSFPLTGVLKYAVPALLLACLALVFILSLRTRSRAAAFASAAFALALFRMWLAAPDSVPAGEYALSGTVSSISERSAYSVVLTDAELDGTKLRYPVRLLIGDRDSPPPAVGDSLKTEIVLKEDYDGLEDIDLSRLSSGIGLALECKSVNTVSRNGLPFTRWVDSVRSRLGARIRRLFPENGAVASAFLIGDRSELTHDEREIFRGSGVAHLLALSGLHVGVLTGMLLLIIPKGLRRTRFFAVLLFLSFYCVVTGFPASLVRASVMTVCLLFAELTERRRDPLSSISLAALVILAVSPYSLWSVGFRLTFAATLGIILLVGEQGAYSRSIIADRVISAVGVTFAAVMATIVITARRYGYVSTYTLPVNLLAVPVFSLTVILCFVLLILSFPLPFIAERIAWIPDRIMSGASFLLERASLLPNSRIYLGYPPEICGWLMLLFMFIISPYVLRPVKKRALISLPVLLLFTICLAFSIISV